ncbi:hypothetical protein FKW77_009355 [Venturia effusa]|uniref:Restriction of telomere capping protein 4 n=1 Tax=Venturia effusa TaxID=50376 RepID=A0A517LBM6_9PEZI|nr:hypothetical protein FKW77_009355 [Venturia effusa]
MHDYKDARKTRSAKLIKMFRVPSRVPNSLQTRESKRLAVPDVVDDHIPTASKTALHVPPEVPPENASDEEKDIRAIDADPESSDDDAPTASADIPRTLFTETPKKETRQNKLGSVTNGIRGNSTEQLTKNNSESPDSKKAKEWEEYNRRPIERRKRQGCGTGPRRDKPKSFSSRISAASTNIHAVEAKRSGPKEKVVTKTATPKKRKGCLNIPEEIPFAASPRSASRRNIKIPETSLLTPVTTQSSPSPTPSPKKKRRFEKEDDWDGVSKKSERAGSFLFDSSSPLSSAPEEYDETEAETQCSFCFQEVDRTLAEMYAWPSSRPTMQQKGEYCTWHRTKEAEKKWQEQGYPTINWTQLKDGLSEYDSELEQLINDPETSHYRQVLKDKTKGKIHSLARMQEEDDVDLELELGFYGYRGLDMITNYVTTTFHDLLRTKSAGDHVISASARGVAHYARLVLAKELATMLIRDEMKVSLERARDILIESTSVGEILHGKEVHAETGDSRKSKTRRRVYVDWDGNDIEPTQC